MSWRVAPPPKRADKIAAERRARLARGESSLAVCSWGRTRRVWLASLDWDDYSEEEAAVPPRQAELLLAGG